mmetsp:Transcript_1855/g.4444  ORF Transcript_1855/g.4444 Transcript_1855/m.4444 type:complete len:213 (+) Transcript_1855:107-745(+)
MEKWMPSSRRYLAFCVSICMSAAIGNSVASAFRVPYEVLKQQRQTATPIRLTSLRDLFPMGGIAIQMMRDIPYAMITLLTYECLQRMWSKAQQQQQQQQQQHAGGTNAALLGSLAGGLGTFLTNPMDVIKTRIQTDPDGMYPNIAACISSTWQEGGPAAFLRGSVPRLMHKVPANGFFFVFYEFFRSLLQVERTETASTQEVSSSEQEGRKA